MACDQCQVVRINGSVTHELGCPNFKRDPITMEYYDRECKWCGAIFKPETDNQMCCDNTCWESYSGR